LELRKTAGWLAGGSGTDLGSTLFVSIGAFVLFVLTEALRGEVF